jgi:hypothetical protein
MEGEGYTHNTYIYTREAVSRESSNIGRRKRHAANPLLPL